MMSGTLDHHTVTLIALQCQEVICIVAKTSHPPSAQKQADAQMSAAKGRKVTSNHRLTPEGKRLLVLLAEHLGLDQTGVIETLIRDRARAEGLK